MLDFFQIQDNGYKSTCWTLEFFFILPQAKPSSHFIKILTEALAYLLDSSFTKSGLAYKKSKCKKKKK